MKTTSKLLVMVKDVSGYWVLGVEGVAEL